MLCKCDREMINMGKVVEEVRIPLRTFSVLNILRHPRLLFSRTLLHNLTALPPMILWSCPPEGCGRIFMEGAGGPMKGTWYTAEENEIEDLPI